MTGQPTLWDDPASDVDAGPFFVVVCPHCGRVLDRMPVTHEQQSPDPRILTWRAAAGWAYVAQAAHTREEHP